MFTGGHCGGVGLGGFLLQGGQGWNSRRWGWGCENVVGVDVVTAEGEQVHASEDAHADLFWAARGAGPYFPGVVTRFHLRTYPAAADVPRHADLPARGSRAAAALAARAAAHARRRGRARGRRVAARAAAAHDADRGRRGRRRARLLAPFDAARSRALAHERGPTTIMAGEPRPGGAEPRGPPLRRGLAVDGRGRGDAVPAAARPLRARSPPTSRSRSGTAGRPPARCRTWRSRSSTTSTWPRTRSGPTPADDERMRDWVHDQHARLAEVGEGVYVGDSRLRAPARPLPERRARRAAGRRARGPRPGRGVRMRALVTGAAGGIGAAIARAARRRRLRRARRRPRGRRPGRRRRGAAAGPRRRPVDVLVNNAADLSAGRLEELDLATWRRVQAVNVEAPLLLSRALVPGMRERGWGRIVNVVSDTFHRPPASGMSAYIASKGALIGLTRALARRARRRRHHRQRRRAGPHPHRGRAARRPAGAVRARARARRRCRARWSRRTTPARSRSSRPATPPP